MTTTLLDDIRQQLETLESKMLAAELSITSSMNHIHPGQEAAARNLLHYLALRNEDIRELQDNLHAAGLSSLASSESHIHSQVQSILQRMGKQPGLMQLDACDYNFARKQMIDKSRGLFGEKTTDEIPYLMVTFDASFADNYAIVKTLLQNGMSVARINCAHDDEATWSRMINLVKRASRHTGIACKIYMDLAGPKIRTKLLGKGSGKGKTKLEEGQLVWLAEEAMGFGEEEVVIGVNEKGIIRCLKNNERVFIDDGVIKGVIEKIYDDKAEMRIVRVAGKHHIKNDKGINFPDSLLDIPSLTTFDRQCLPFISSHADMVGYSFVRYPADLKALQDALTELPGKHPHIIVKIETPEAVRFLPGLLLQGMRQPLFGAMIARGDLAVEIGFERMGEIQDEILWICEAAHVPVIWATQVLESLNKSGMATRSEITDAAHAALAECVMINKGDHTIEVLETLRDIMQRMGGHHIKKRFTFRPLSIAQQFMNESRRTYL